MANAEHKLSPLPEDGPVYAALADRLARAGVEYATTRHQPVYTSAEAAAVRGADLHSGAKALVVKAGDRFVMIVLPADLSLDSKAARKELGCKSIRFASKEEVHDLTGLTPGSIPPFGSLFGLETYCDVGLADNARINFNAGAHTVSMSMAYDAYAAFEGPALGAYAAPPSS